ncbi:MAG TPA: VC0807 family protein [Rhizomicrobium sp.]|jgi:hypothetical protein
MSRVTQLLEWIREHAWQIATEVGINFALPFVIYSLLQPKYGDVDALLASSAPPILWSIVEFVRRRTVDALSLLVLLGIALSLLAFVGGGGVKFLQLREKLVTILIGSIFLGSALIGKPIMYVLVQASLKRTNNKEEMERFEAIKDRAEVRYTMVMMTATWGAGLLSDAAVSIALVFLLSIKTYMVINPILGWGTVGGLSAWSVWYGRRRRREGERLREAAEQAAATQASAQTP